MTIIIKISFIIFFALLTLFLMYEEYNNAKTNLLTAGFKRRAMDIIGVTSGLVTLFSFVEVQRDKSINREKEREAQLLLDQKNEEIQQILKDLAQKRQELRDSRNTVANLQEQVESCEQQKSLILIALEYWKSHNNAISKKEEVTKNLKNSSKNNTELLKEIEALEKETEEKLDSYAEKANKSIEEVQKIDKSNLINFSLKE